MANGGLTPILSTDALRELGYLIAIFPSLTSLVAAPAIRTTLTRLKSEGRGDDADLPMTDFKHFCSRIGFEDVWAFERRWAR